VNWFPRRFALPRGIGDVAAESFCPAKMQPLKHFFLAWRLETAATSKARDGRLNEIVRAESLSDASGPHEDGDGAWIRLSALVNRNVRET